MISLREGIFLICLREPAQAAPTSHRLGCARTFPAVSDDNSAYQYTYNADGEETSQSDVGSPDLPTVTLTYEYDADGYRTSMDDSLGGLVSYTYDARDELTNETLSGTDISAIAVANTYDNAGNMTGQTRYSNTAETDVVATTSYTYDDAEQMTGITDKNSSGTTLVSYGYTFNAAGLVTPGDADVGFGVRHRHARLHVHEQRPAHGRDAHERCVLQRELQLRRQRQPNRHGLYDQHRQRADGLSRQYVHV